MKPVFGAGAGPRPRAPRPESDRGRPSFDGLADLAHAVAGAGDQAAIYRALFQYVRSVSPTHAIFVALYDEHARLRTCIYSARPDAEDDVAQLPALGMTGSPQCVAIDTGRPVLIADLDAALVGMPAVDLGVDVDPRMPRSSLAVPMLVLGRTIGALEVQSLDLDAYTEDHAAAMSLAASIAALATDRIATAERGAATLTASRERIRGVIAGAAFATVFQPIVDLETRQASGYEALTRFVDGSSPQHIFEQASAAGLGLELEAATLESAFRASEALPANVWLNVNVSAELLLAREPLATLLGQWGWQTVLEVTEHIAIDDYDAVREAVGALGGRVRLAVDDAGAGFASFRHILELGPHIVKLDRAVVHSIDVDAARQAFVAGMCHFADTTGCVLIAEGVETEAEALMLRSLGVPLAQGYHLGAPRPVPLTPTGPGPGTPSRQRAATRGPVPARPSGRDRPSRGRGVRRR